MVGREKLAGRRGCWPLGMVKSRGRGMPVTLRPSARLKNTPGKLTYEVVNDSGF